jgi:leucyl/phenylalanyl-tRNA--protein transferase
MVLLDTQFMTPHLARLGAVEISRAEYERRLERAIHRDVSFADPPAWESS